MAYDWIPIRHDLQDDPHVLSVSRRISAHPARVVGALARLWSVFDRNSEDDFLSGATLEWVDVIVDLVGFGAALAEYSGAENDTPWIVVEPKGLRFPGIHKYISKTAKRRAKEAKRKSDYEKQRSGHRAIPAQTRASAQSNPTLPIKDKYPPNPPSDEGGNQEIARMDGAENNEQRKKSRAERKREDADRAVRDQKDWLERRAETQRQRDALRGSQKP